MRSNPVVFLVVVFFLSGIASAKNLTPSASISASGRLNSNYAGKNVADGIIPAARSGKDVGSAWCVPQAQAKNASVTFEWESPVAVAEVVYWGRTAFLDSENFRTCEIFLDDSATPAASITLQSGAAGQRIPLGKTVTAKKLTLRFPTNHGGPNPGASEIAVFDSRPDDSSLAAMGGPPAIPETLITGEKIQSGDLGFTKIVVCQRMQLSPSHVYTYHQEGLRPGGGLWVCDFSAEEVRKTMILGSPEGVILDLNLDYEGRTILFSWKRTMEENFQIYTVDIDGENLTQITNHESNNFNACWLPDGGIAFLSDRKPAFAYCWKTTTPILWRSAADGSKAVRLSANYLNDFTPSVFSDGRIVYSRWEYVDRPAIPIQSLWSINPDGTGLAGVFGNRVLSPATFMDAREIPGSDGAILCVLTSHNGPCRGAIGIVDAKLGSNAADAIKNITPEIDLGRIDSGGDGNRIRGPYLNPFPLDDEYFLVSKTGDIELRDYQMEYSARILGKTGELGFYAPQPVRERKRERLLTSTLPETLTADQEWATIFMQDVYEGLGGKVARGSITRLAIVQEMEKPLGIDPSKRAFGFQFPVVSAGATYAPKKIWGYAKVEEDGSAHFCVPAREPIYFLPIDEEGRAVQRMRTFTHLMPGEVQSCVGCHADRNSVTPRRQERRSIAMSRKAEKLSPPEWGVHGFSYAQLVQPVLDKHCVRCHGFGQKAGDLELTGDKTDFFNVSYDNLIHKDNYKYVQWIPTYNGQEANILEIEPGRWGAKASLLGQVIADGHPDGGGERRIDLSPDEKHRLYAWMDLNVPYYRSSDSAYQENRGCRQIVPPKLDAVFAEIARRRCVSCHADLQDFLEAPGRDGFFLRLDHPERNGFLNAPLANKAGGSEACGKAIFPSTDDPDYQSLINTFEDARNMLKVTPRMDMRPMGNTAGNP